MPPQPTTNPFDFSGRRVLITGGSRGLGRSTSEAFLDRGAQVTICARHEPSSPVVGSGGEATFLPCDVRDSAGVLTLVAAAADYMGGIDILVNNAGGAPPAAAKDSGGTFNEKIIGLNLLGPMNMSVAAYPFLAASEHGGVIINISSVSGMRANPKGVAYGAAKAGLVNMTKTLALEWGPDIRVLAVTSGPLYTEGAADFWDPAEVDRLSAVVPMKRMGTEEDVINVVLFACSPLATWMTGSNIVIDGGPEWPAGGYQS